MSLNGLDAPELQTAFEHAAQEAGRWFLLKYVSRDDVELLGKGDSGTAEMRELVEKELTETPDSPMYGFIRYRRRNVLIKIVPEGASRVVKARTQVHFQFVSERFTTHDNAVTVTKSKDLTDSMLSTACSTHSSTGSISSSSSSLKNRRLEDIAESAEENEDEPNKKRKSTAGGIGPSRSAKRPRSPLAVEILPGNNDTASEDNAKTVAQEPADSQPLIPPPATTTDENKENNASASPNTLALPRESIEKRRKSTSSVRPSLDSLSSFYKPKVKVGPRPLAEAPKRPHTSAGGERPIASVPRGVNIVPRKREPQPQQQPQEQLAETQSLHEPKQRPSLDLAGINKSQENSSTPAIPAFAYHFKDLPALPLTPVTPNSSTPISRQFDNPLASRPGLHPPTPTTPTALSPEKQKLMKALQLRRRTMQLPPVSAPPVESAEEVKKEEKEEQQVKEIKEIVVPELEIRVIVSEHEKVRMDVEKTVSSPAASHESVDDDEESVEENSEVVPVVAIKVEEVADKEEKETVGGEDDKAEENVPAEKKDLLEPEAAEKNATPAAEESEGCKVRGGLESDVESDAEEQVQAAVEEQRPVTPMQETIHIAASTPATPVSPASNLVKTITIPASPETKTAQKPSVLKRLDREKFVVDGEIPVVETARSVSAGRFPQSTTPVIKKVNVSSGSVSQRIRQFQALATSPASAPAATAAPKLSPPRSRDFPLRSTSLSNLTAANVPAVQDRPRAHSRSGDRPQLPQIRKFSFSNAAPIQPPQLFPSPVQAASKPAPSSSTAEFRPVVSDSKRPNAPALQVTTKIIRDTEPESFTAPPQPQQQRPQTSVSSSNRRTSIDMASFASLNAPRRSSVDFTSKKTATSPITDSARSFFGLPPLPQSPTKSPMSPTLTKKQSKEEKREEKRRSRSSTAEKRSPVMPLLRRMSSTLSRRKNDKEALPSPEAPADPVFEAPASPAKKQYLLSGWVNVQLPDTMLWRRRCMKIDSNGWLFLALSDDEFTPQTRRYHIPTEVRQAKVPDPDEQELPFSVVVCFEEGGELQCACQNAREQKEVLSVIRGCIA